MTDSTAADVAPIEFICTEADFLDAQRLHHTLSLRGRRFLIRMAWAIMVMVVVLTAALIFGAKNTALEAVTYGLIAVALYASVMTILILANRMLVLPRAARRQLRQLKEFGGPVTVAVDPPRIVLTTKNGVSEVPTADFLKWAENSKSILLYRADRQFNLMPKRVIGDAFHRCLIAELNRAGVPKAGFSNS